MGVVGWDHEEKIRWGVGGSLCWTALGWDENAEFERNTENTRSQTKCSTLPFSQTSLSKQRVVGSTAAEMNFESFGAVVATYGLGISVAQPAPVLASVNRVWGPHRSGLGASVTGSFGCHRILGSARFEEGRNGSEQKARTPQHWRTPTPTHPQLRPVTPAAD